MDFRVIRLQLATDIPDPMYFVKNQPTLILKYLLRVKKWLTLENLSYLPDDKEIKSFYEELFLWPTVDGELEPEEL